MNIKRICALFGIVLLSGFASHGVFAQENASEFVMIANVNLVNQGIVAQNGRVFKVGVNLQNKIGTQSGIVYGVKVVKVVDGKEITVDQFANPDLLTLKQNEYAYKEFDYTLPTAISGEVTLFAFISTDKGITLATAPLTKEPTNVPSANSHIIIKSCAVDKAANTLSCTLSNPSKSALEANLITTIKQSNSVFAAAATTLPIQKVSLKTKEEKLVTQSINTSFLAKDVTFESVLFDTTNTTPLDRLAVTELNTNQPRLIDNVLIEQTSPRDYVVKVVSLAPTTAQTKAKITLSDGKKMCQAQEVSVEGTVTSIPFALKKSCDTANITVEFVDENGVVTDSFKVEHKTLFPEAKSAINPLWILGGLAAIAILAIIIKRRKTV